MEQKKILWIVVLVAGCLLLIFGVALLLYAPSRSTGVNVQQSSAFTPAVNTANSPNNSQGRTGIDPDSWVREPGSTPGLDSNQPPAQGDINLTIVNGDNAGANYGTMDVSGLTQPSSPGSNLTVAAGTALPAIPGQDPQTTVIQNGTNATATATVSTTKTSTTVTSQAKVTEKATTAKTVTTKAAEPVKATPKKLVTVTEYWIQTGSFSSKLNAEKAREALTARYLTAEIFTKDVAGTNTYRVRVGPYKSKSEADYWLGTVKEIPDFKNSFVSEVKAKK